MSSIKDFFSEEQKKAIEAAIVESEKNTSGEIRIHIEKHCKGDVVERAVKIFHKLEMNKTNLHNGVLFYVSVSDHKLAVVGDSGINSVVPVNFWEEIKNNMIAKFKEHSYTEGICDGIKKAGEQLKSHFPYLSDDKNELSNEVTFGK